MKCMSKELLGILPAQLREAVRSADLTQAQELRLKVGCQAVLRLMKEDRHLSYRVSREDLSFVLNAASRYSPWNSVSAARGYLTAPGGHRIGICGEAVLDKCAVQTLRVPGSLCIRIARDLPGIGAGVDLRDSILIIGPPGSGKTTLLRDLIRRLCLENRGPVSVVDERGEIFPQSEGKSCFDSANADVLLGCPKPEGIEMVLRSMGPAWLAVDEITAKQDCEALLQAGWCGVKLLATVHAGGVEDLLHRPVYRPLVESRLFRTGLVLSRDKHWERVVL